MIARLTRSLTCLATVLVAFWAYNATAVRWIEPTIAAQPVAPSTPQERDSARRITRRYAGLLEAYFPAGHWARDEPKVLVSDQAMLLIRDYERLEGGRVALVPCAVVFFPQGRSDQPQRDAVIAEAPEGAVLEFEGGFDLAQARIGRLAHGTFQGPLTIRSDMRAAGPADDLQVVAHGVQLDSRRIWTEEPVEFRLGPHAGRGTALEMRLRPGAAGELGGGLDSVELARDVELHLDFGSRELLPGGGTPGLTAVAPQTHGQSAASPPAAAKGGPPVDVSCRGPFRFDLAARTISFREQVDVVRLHPQGPSDQLNCEQLTIHLAPHATEEPAGDNATGGLPRLEPVALEAVGDPVVVRAPSRGGEVRCEKLHYDIKTRKIQLAGQHGVSLLEGPHAIHAPALEYQPSLQAGRMGTLWAAGPGRLQTAPPQRPDQALEAHWQQALRMQPQESGDIVSLVGRPRLRSGVAGELQADELHLWLRAGAEPLPDRMLANGAVQLVGPQLRGDCERLEVWFEPSTADQTAADRSMAPGGGPAPLAGRPASGPKSKFRARGDLIRLLVALGPDGAAVRDMTVSGGVDVRELPAVRSDDGPLVIRGDRMQLSAAGTPSEVIGVSGRPLHVAARGLTLSGGEVQLSRPANRVWMDGAGTLLLPMPAPSNGVGGAANGMGRTTPAEQPLRVTWEGRMDFDGRRLEFVRGVTARSATQTLHAESLTARFTQPLRLGGSLSEARPDVAQLSAGGGVSLENRTLDGGNPTSIDRLEAQGLELDRASGELQAAGPGWLTTVRRGSTGPLAGGAGATESSDGLEYLRVEFQQAITGNLNRRRVQFAGGVQTLYGPVPTWESVLAADARGELPTGAVLLTCDRLGVAEVRAPGATEPSLELEALGNSLIEGQAFTARAERMAYAQAKDLVVLEGSARRDAQLWRQTRIGGPTSHAAARKILYWRTSGRVQVDDARFLDLSQLGGPARQ